jgi:hypothetical protein
MLWTIIIILLGCGCWAFSGHGHLPNSLESAMAFIP